MSASVRKIVRISEVVNNGLGCLYASEDDGRTFTYSEPYFIKSVGGSRIRVGNSGLNLYQLTRKQRRRIFCLTNRGCSVYLIAEYKKVNHIK